MMQQQNEPWVHDKEYTKYTLWFIYACIIYSIIGFSWGALMGGLPGFRQLVDNYGAHGHRIVLAHTHINLLGWVEMAIFGAVYYLVPTYWCAGPIYSLRLVKVHFWMHNLGLLGVVIFFFAAGVAGIYSDDASELTDHISWRSLVFLAAWYCWQISFGDITSSELVKDGTSNNERRFVKYSCCLLPDKYRRLR